MSYTSSYQRPISLVVLLHFLSSLLKSIYHLLGNFVWPFIVAELGKGPCHNQRRLRIPLPQPPPRTKQITNPMYIQRLCLLTRDCACYDLTCGSEDLLGIICGFAGLVRSTASRLCVSLSILLWLAKGSEICEIRLQCSLRGKLSPQQLAEARAAKQVSSCVLQ